MSRAIRRDLYDHRIPIATVDRADKLAGPLDWRRGLWRVEGDFMAVYF